MMSPSRHISNRYDVQTMMNRKPTNLDVLLEEVTLEHLCQCHDDSLVLRQWLRQQFLVDEIEVFFRQYEVDLYYVKIEVKYREVNK